MNMSEASFLAWQKQFSTEDDCLKYLQQMKWPNCCYSGCLDKLYLEILKGPGRIIFIHPGPILLLLIVGRIVTIHDRVRDSLDVSDVTRFVGVLIQVHAINGVQPNQFHRIVKNFIFMAVALVVSK
jgi:hypothetical protein